MLLPWPKLYNEEQHTLHFEFSVSVSVLPFGRCQRQKGRRWPKGRRWLKGSSWRSKEKRLLFRLLLFSARKTFWERIRGCCGCGCPGRILFFGIRRRAIKFNVWSNRKWRLHLNFPQSSWQGRQGGFFLFLFLSLFNVSFRHFCIKLM